MRTLFNQALQLRGRRVLHSSQNTVIKQSRPYHDRRVFTACQTWTYMRTMFILVNTPFMQDKHTCDSSLRGHSSKHDILEYTCAIHRHNTLKSYKTPGFYRACIHENGEKCQSCSKPSSVGHTFMGTLIPVQFGSPTHVSHLGSKLLLI